MEKIKKLEDKVILKKVLSTLRYSANEFSKEIDLTPSALYHVLNGANRLTVDLSNRIVKRFPEVNYSYLVLGEGTVLNEVIVGEKETQFDLFNQTQGHISFDEIPITLKNIENLLIKILKKIEVK